MIYWVAFVLLVAGLILLAVTWALHGKSNALETIKGFVLDFILDAEKQYGSGTGQFKRALVVDMILNSAFYNGLPGLVRQFITASALGAVIDAVCVSFKRQLESNKDNMQRLLDEPVYVAGYDDFAPLMPVTATSGYIEPMPPEPVPETVTIAAD